MRRHIPLQLYPRDVQIAAHMIGLDYKRPYTRHGRRYYKPYRNYFYSALSGDDFKILKYLEKKGYTESGKPSEKGVYFWLTRDGLDWLGRQLHIEIHDCKH